MINEIHADAVAWLAAIGSDQWQQPWLSEDGRNQRVLDGLVSGRTWIAWDGVTPVATLTTDADDHGVWPKHMRDDRAVYVSRLVVARSYAGHRVGAQLLDWAGLRARGEYGAAWVRVDVWTTNTALHDYYFRQGFEFSGLCDTIPGYPSAALFQKPTAHITQADIPALREVPDTS
ncbi:MAG TPA: GNAT family N-acetyltransferase [Streptosporangiaceae bacterium]|nr:GNAT family N-acetyltransferase [Streptosporangiaceae bacterium]